MNRLSFLAIVLVALLDLTGCPCLVIDNGSTTTAFDSNGNPVTTGDCPDPNNTQAGQFWVATVTVDTITQIALPAPKVLVGGDWLGDIPGANGTVYHFKQITDNSGITSVGGGRTPADWELYWLISGGPGSQCNQSSETIQILPNYTEYEYCFLEPVVPLADGSQTMLSPPKGHIGIVSSAVPLDIGAVKPVPLKAPPPPTCKTCVPVLQPPQH